ncbi:biotin transporter BioY [Paenibacillus sp. IB182496]|uniref:Biotin transporter n=1 Tax=Paenibacillus sabuli TaxID=2772509 RepID=A0A927BR37_9BACL|nr:biotin transporter BioY [Paenibacillus sabuli]MBD2845203.1 biotin transporter BioY [Paenibacillus sabuli]
MSHSLRSLVYTALFAALFIVMSYIKIPLGFTAVPLSLQPLAVMLAGAFLGPVYGFLSIFSVIALAAVGLPLIQGNGGLSLMLGFTGGFLWMFPVCAWAVGLATGRLLRSRGLARQKTLRAGALFVTIFFCGSLSYLAGVPWYTHVADISLSKAMVAAMYPFLPGDVIKAVVATILVLALRAYAPQLQTATRRRGSGYAGEFASKS